MLLTCILHNKFFLQPWLNRNKFRNSVGSLQKHSPSSCTLKQDHKVLLAQTDLPLWDFFYLLLNSD